MTLTQSHALTNDYVLNRPYFRNGDPTNPTYIILYILKNGPSNKENIVSTMGKDVYDQQLIDKEDGKENALRGYMSGTFSALSQNEILKYNRKDNVWCPGNNFYEYINEYLIHNFDNEYKELLISIAKEKAADINSISDQKDKLAQMKNYRGLFSIAGTIFNEFKNSNDLNPGTV